MQSVLAVVNLQTVRENARRILRCSGRPLIAVVKDDAYGHGAVRVAQALETTASAFAVSTVEEGAALRVCGVEKPVLVLTPPLSEEEGARIAAYSLTASVGSVRALWSGGFEAHIAVNTGMNRYGVRPERLPALLRAAKMRGVRVTGVYSHLYAPADAEAVREQTLRFERACALVKGEFPTACAHLAATGGMLAGVRFDAVRAGIGLYGYLPEGFEGKLAVKPAMKVYAAVADARKRLGGGRGYGYAEGEEAFHTLRAGYGDGFFRTGGFGSGDLCMDACILEGMARVGSRKLILSDAAAYAKAHGTTAYEVLTAVTKRAEFVYR